MPASFSLPVGFRSSASFDDMYGAHYPANLSLNAPVTIAKGYVFLDWFIIPAGFSLEDIDQTEVMVYVNGLFWQSPPYQVTCSYPCTLSFPPYPIITTWAPPVVITSADSTAFTTQPPVITAEHIHVSKITMSRSDPSTKTTTITTGSPLCPEVTLNAVLFKVKIPVCPLPLLLPFPPPTIDFPGLPVPSITIFNGPTQLPAAPGNTQPPDDG